MKIKHLLIGMLAMAAAVACKQDEPVEEPKLEVNKTAVALAATAAEGAFEVTANNAWSADVDADWVSLDPANGAGGEKAVTVKVTAEDNTAEARTATVTVKSGKLTKTVKVAQAAAAVTPGPGEDPDAPTYILVGEAVGGWDVDKNGVVLTLKEGYYEAKGVAVTGKKGMHFTKNNQWEGNVKGLHGLIAPNEIGEVGNNDISLTEDGLYDVYLTEALDKFYFMTEGKLPSEAVEHKEISTVWGVCGAIEGNAWGAGSDPEMTLEDEWYVAKNITFTEVNLKIRGNNSWADDVKWGTATKNQTCELNKAVAVSTCTEFKAANPSESDNPNIYIAAPAGAYDVYFSPEKKEVWVMTPGYKPGDETPTPVEPVTEGDIWENDGTVGAAAWSGSPYRFAKEGMDGLNECCAQIPAAVWEGMKIAPFCVNVKPATAETEWWQIRVLDGWWTKNDESGDSDINPQSAGLVNNGDGTYTFQVDLTTNPDLVALIDKQHLLFAGDGFIINKMYFGDLPTPGEPEQPELQKSEWALVGSFGGWDPKSDLYLSVLDENYFVYYGFDMPAGAEFKFLKGGVWPPDGQEVGGNGLVQPNTIQAAGGSNIKVNEAGKYDIYLAADLSKFYIMSEGKLPSEATEPAPVEKTWGMMGCFVDNTWAKDVPMTKEGEWIVAKGAQFTELTFKIRANESWSDATNIGLAPGSAKGEINTKVSVVTAEYAKANLGGDAADIKLNGEAGTYDVYFSYDNLEVYVMTPGLKPGETPTPEPEYTLDGKQWMAEMEGMQVLFDFGLAEEGMLVVGMPSMDGTGFGLYMAGLYEIVPTNGTSGVITFTQYDWEWDEFGDPVEIPYSELTATTVKAVSEGVFGTTEPISFTLVENPYEIAPPQTGGDGPSGAIENGEYWFFNGDKVMAPLAEGVTTGTLPASNVISGASTEKNIFTLTYDPDMTYYTIQDSYGRYLGQTDETGNITVTDVLPTDDTYAFYLWAVETGYGEACSIYNAAYYYDITYSAADNNWVLVDGGYEFPETLPVLVKAENPVEEPVEPSFEAGQYFIMDGQGKMVSPIAEGSTYGYWNVTPAVEDGDAYIGYAENVFTIAKVDGGYTIQDVYGRHHYMTTYNSFSVSKNTQSDNSHVWTIDLQNDGSYAIVNVKTGKTVQFSSYGNYAPYTDVTGPLPYLVKADKVAEKPSAPEEEVAQYATNVKCTTVSSAYTDGVATVNGVADVFTLKLGTSKLNGKAKVTIPAGSTEVTYYAVGWKGTSAKLQFSVGGSVVSSQSIAANTGATGNSPYTMTVADSDHYTVSFGSPLEADTEVTVETTGSAYRAILFGIQAK